MEKFWLEKKYQREKKYRVFNKKLGLLEYDDTAGDIYIGLNGELIWRGYSPSSDEFVTHNYIIMQFTGLKDIKKKEAYELDIIKRNLIHDDSLYIIRFGQYWNGEEYEDWEGGDGWFVTKITDLDIFDEVPKKEAEKCGIAWGRSIPREFEILGNPFENPELIEQC